MDASVEPDTDPAEPIAISIESPADGDSFVDAPPILSGQVSGLGGGALTWQLSGPAGTDMTERALDQTVREIRIGQGDLNSHAALKERICQAAAVLPSCTEMLHLEMIRLDMRNWSGPRNRADCVDTSEEVTPNRTFEHATENQTMYLRACFKFRPITPAGTLSSSLQKDDAGYTALISTSAFVTEPS